MTPEDRVLAILAVHAPVEVLEVSRLIRQEQGAAVGASHVRSILYRLRDQSRAEPVVVKKLRCWKLRETGGRPVTRPDPRRCEVRGPKK